ncbi:MAG: hypothetical protein MJA29_06910 [Candidatus Omnitrophica bacterium]|nr:hypothetical protein [Candidatus Omnitrophota bacterium]
MKKAVVITVAVGVLLLSAGQVCAAKKTLKPVLSDAQRRTIMQQASQSLTGRTWTVYWVMQGEKKSSVRTDTLTFEGSGVKSQYLVTRGFMGSAYSMHVRDDQAAVWETVQRNEKEDLAMIRGELSGNILVGTVNIRRKDGGSELYSISTIPPEGVKVSTPKLKVKKE